MEERESLGSRLGFLLISAGCAIGIGNVWKFPYLVGKNGGGAFVLIYLIFLVLIGVPVLTMEFAMGRASQKSIVRLYKTLTPDKPVWSLHGIVALFGNFMLMMFYTSVAAWMLSYLLSIASGAFSGLDAAGVAERFGAVTGNPVGMVVSMGAVVALGFFVCSRGLQAGLERVSTFMMSALLVIMVVLAFRSAFLPGGSEGLKFYLVPDFGRLRAIGYGSVIVDALNQAFFTLSIGMGSMAIFGSYIDKKHSLLSESINVAMLDTFVAIASSLIIFPACFAYGVQPDRGPSLIFITLPNIFNHMPLGRLWGSLFFLFLCFAAFSTVIGVFENIIACTMELTGRSRGEVCLFGAPIMFLLSLPCALSGNLLSGIHPMGGSSSIMDLEDFIISNLVLPLGALVMVLYCLFRFGWGWKKFRDEANTGSGLKLTNRMRPYLMFVLPVCILALLIIGLI